MSEQNSKQLYRLGVAATSLLLLVACVVTFFHLTLAIALGFLGLACFPILAHLRMREELSAIRRLSLSKAEPLDQLSVSIDTSQIDKGLRDLEKQISSLQDETTEIRQANLNYHELQSTAAGLRRDARFLRVTAERFIPKPD